VSDGEGRSLLREIGTVGREELARVLRGIGLLSPRTGDRPDTPAPEPARAHSDTEEERQARFEQAIAELSERFEARRRAREQRKADWAGRADRRARAALRRPDQSTSSAPPVTADSVPSAATAATATEPPEASAPPASTPACDSHAEIHEVPLTAGAYDLPRLGLLAAHHDRIPAVSDEDVALQKRIIQSTLDSFGIDAEVGEATVGPRVTLVEVHPARGVKVEAIAQIENNLAMDLAAVSLRILAPVPGQKTVGIEVPNREAVSVHLSSLLAGDAWRSAAADLPLVVGRSITGTDVILDLARAPHLLIAGATGSGKSVCLNAMLMSLLFRFSPQDLRLILVDPKVVEFSCYRDLPHLLTPVITQVQQVLPALQWVIREMEQRYQVLAAAGVRNIKGFNRRRLDDGPGVGPDGESLPERLPYIVVIIDELADIMMTARGDVELSLARIAQLSRAVGIHTVIATQRPSVNVITGIIKANYPTRIAFQVSAQADSRTILDGKGAEALRAAGSRSGSETAGTSGPGAGDRSHGRLGRAAG
jgi:S-DNA-T family DNA segregation ATPase FtsK/SpoIIIE